MLLLGLLTWFATLEQIDNGLYPTLTKYFDWKSVFLLPEINGKMVPLPLPGGYWVCAVLLLNLILGGIIRIRKGWRHYGNLIAHFGIIFMLVGRRRGAPLLGARKHGGRRRGLEQRGGGLFRIRRRGHRDQGRQGRHRARHPRQGHRGSGGREAAHLPPAGHALRSGA